MEKPVAKTYTSIKKTFLRTNITLLLLSIIGISTVIFLSWYGSIEKGARAMAMGASHNITKQIDKYLEAPVRSNDMIQALIKNASALSEEQVRSSLLLAVSSVYEQSVYSVGYTTPSGTNYVIRCAGDNMPQCFQTNVITDGGCDPREKTWYQAAVKKGSTDISITESAGKQPVLSIVASSPVYAPNGELLGVLDSQSPLNVNMSLTALVSSYKGYGFVVEKDTGYLIANSVEEENYVYSEDGTVLRHTPLNFQTSLLNRVYGDYLKTGEESFVFKERGEKWYVQVQDYSRAGLEWTSFALYPESRLSSGFSRNIAITVIFILLTELIAIVLNNLIIRKIFSPVNDILSAAKEFAAGKLSARITPVRNDEISEIAIVFNDMANQVQQLVLGLEDTVFARTQELMEQKNQLRLILDTTAEAIFGTDLKGNCTFCNKSCLGLLGYSDASELLGKDMVALIYHSAKNGTRRPAANRPLTEYLSKGKGGRVQEDILWRSDGS